MPQGFQPIQHPRLVEKPPSGERWIHEIKFDGYRLQVRVEAGRARIFTRNGHDWTDKFPELAADAGGLTDCILDGELCALSPDGMPTFSALRASITPGKTAKLVLFVFDLLWAGGEDMRPYSLIGRKAVLQDVLEEISSTRFRFVEHFETGGQAILTSSCSMQLEGIVSKRRDAIYSAGRPDTWVKSKCRPSQEVVIGGWKQAPGGAFQSLLVGVYEAGRLRFAGSLKTGFGRGAHGLLARLHALKTPTSPFELGDPPRKTSEIHWCKPELVAAAEIAEWTASGKLRQASFKGLREDKRPTDVSRDRPDARLML